MTNQKKIKKMEASKSIGIADLHLGTGAYHAICKGNDLLILNPKPGKSVARVTADSIVTQDNAPVIVVINADGSYSTHNDETMTNRALNRMVEPVNSDYIIRLAEQRKHSIEPLIEKINVILIENAVDVQSGNGITIRLDEIGEDVTEDQFKLVISQLHSNGFKINQVDVADHELAFTVRV